MTISDLIKLLTPTGLAMLELALEDAAETDPNEDTLIDLYHAKTQAINAGVNVWGTAYHDLVWAVGIAVEHAVEDAPDTVEFSL